MNYRNTIIIKKNPTTQYICTKNPNTKQTGKKTFIQRMFWNFIINLAAYFHLVKIVFLDRGYPSFDTVAVSDYLWETATSP